MLFRSILFLILIFILDYVFIFLSMQKYKNNISSSCLECSLERDIFIYLIIGISVFYILFIVLSMIIKKKYYLYGAIIISLLSLFYYIDYVVFVDRVSSWSTYCPQPTTTKQTCLIIFFVDSNTLVYDKTISKLGYTLLIFSPH